MIRLTSLTVAAALLAGQAAAGDAPQVRIETSLGTFTLALDPAHAPATVANFLHYVHAGHYDGTVVYRVEPGFVIQAGSFDAAGNERAADAPIALETGLKNVRGAVAMARTSEPDSATAEFFVDLADNANLDPDAAAAPNTTGYAVFGTVSEGMDVVDRIAATPKGGTGPFPPASTPMTPVTIKKVSIVDAAP